MVVGSFGFFISAFCRALYYLLPSRKRECPVWTCLQGEGECVYLVQRLSPFAQARSN